MIDHAAALDLELPSFDVVLERGRLRSFAAAVGETDPVYRDVGAAHRAGYRDLPAMPTYLFSIELEAAHPFGYLDAVGADLGGILHGEQTFAYYALLFANDQISVSSCITEAYPKNDRMDFVVKHTEFSRGQECVGEADTLIVVRAVA